MSALRAGPDLEAGKVRLEVHRQRGAQIGEAGMHFAADRAAMRALRPVGRQQPGLRHDLVQIFGDRQRVPHLDAVMGQAGHQERRRQQQQFGAGRGVVGADMLLLEVQPGQLAQQPAAQRPGGIVLAGDGERAGHGHSLLISADYLTLDQRLIRRLASTVRPGRGLHPVPLCRMFTFLSQCNIKCTSVSGIGRSWGPSPDGFRRPWATDAVSRLSDANPT